MPFFRLRLTKLSINSNEKGALLASSAAQLANRLSHFASSLASISIHGASFSVVKCLRRLLAHCTFAAFLYYYVDVFFIFQTWRTFVLRPFLYAFEYCRGASVSLFIDATDWCRAPRDRNSGQHLRIPFQSVSLGTLLLLDRFPVLFKRSASLSGFARSSFHYILIDIYARSCELTIAILLWICASDQKCYTSANCKLLRFSHRRSALNLAAFASVRFYVFNRLMCTNLIFSTIYWANCDNVPVFLPAVVHASPTLRAWFISSYQKQCRKQKQYTAPRKWLHNYNKSREESACVQIQPFHFQIVLPTPALSNLPHTHTYILYPRWFIVWTPIHLGTLSL